MVSANFVGGIAPALTMKCEWQHYHNSQRDTLMSSSLLRASHHEAGHSVYQWKQNGDVGCIVVSRNPDGEWEGACDAPQLESHIDQAIKLLLGGLCEALSAARKDSAVLWQIALNETLPSLKAACRPPWNSKVSIHFCSPTGEQREPLTEDVDELFSNDTVPSIRTSAM